MERRLKASGEECRFVVYPDAGHGFNADYRESYNAADAADGFAQCIAWLHEHRGSVTRGGRLPAPPAKNSRRGA